jgi:uncharacterized protein (TIGR02598 family)
MNPLRNRLRSFRNSGFSLIEVAIATGLCTYALLVIASALPFGVAMIQNANQQVIETEIFNRVWSTFNTTPFYSLQNAQNGATAVFANASTPLYYYYDSDGADVTPSTSGAPAPANAIYTVRISLKNTQTTASLTATTPTVDGGASVTGPSLTFIQVQIGYHYDPASVAAGTTDPRVVTRSFLLAKRDTWNGT